MISLLSVGNIFAVVTDEPIVEEGEDVVTITSIEEDISNTDEESSLEDDSNENENIEPIQIDSQDEQLMIIYVDDNCPHCKDVEAFIAKYDLEDKVLYKNLTNNEDNYTELLALWDDLGISDNEKGWPFLVFEEDGEIKYVVGGAPINDFLAERYEVELEESDIKSGRSSRAGGDGLLLLGGVFFFTVIGFVLYSNITKKS